MSSIALSGVRRIEKSSAGGTIKLKTYDLDTLSGLIPMTRPGRKRKRILIVECEDSIRLPLANSLVKRGFEVTALARLDDAFAAIKAQIYDVLLSDLDLPETNTGLGLIREMRTVQPRCTNFVLTSRPVEESFQWANRSDVAYHFTKPVRIGHLLRIIRQKLDWAWRVPEAIPRKDLRYSWQRVVLDAFMERRSEWLPLRISEAECAITARFSDPDPLELEERVALMDALETLRILFPKAEPEAAEKKQIA